MPHRLPPLHIYLLCILVLSCSDSGPSAPVDTKSPPKPNPNGVLLGGEPGSNALAATRKLPPSPVDDANILDGLLTNRIETVMNSDATVGEVNAALTAGNARIVSMSPRNMFMTLVVPAVASRAEAQAVADALVQSGAFYFAGPVDEVTPPPFPDESSLDQSGEPRRVLPPSGNNGIDHLIRMKMPAAWNASRLAQSSAKIPVLIPDFFVTLTGLPEILFAAIKGKADLKPRGNHGYHVAGIIGARFDSAAPTGTSPDPTKRLEMTGLSSTGLGWFDVIAAIANEFPPTGKFVINTSLGFGSKPLDAADKMELALQAMAWRIQAAPHAQRFLHATAAGNDGLLAGDDGQAKYASAFSVARFFDDLRDVVPLDSLSSADSLNVEKTWAALLLNHPTAATALSNTIVVGSSKASGDESAFSNHGSEIRTGGETVLAPCTLVDVDFPVDANLCDGTTAKYSGTSMATPQIAGLAAYMLALTPQIAISDLRDRIVHAYTAAEYEGYTDAYMAVLSLDQSVSNAPVRKAILDIAGSTPTSPPNGKFDEVDVARFLAEFETANGAAAASTVPGDYSRYDLNGDGFTGGDGFAASFDLDINHPPAYSTVNQNIEGASIAFNEEFASDVDVLCYYAYSSLYAGDVQARSELFEPIHGGGGILVVEFADVIEPGTLAPLRARAGINSGSGTVWTEGIAINVGASDGDVVGPSSGVTDADGWFETNIQIDDDENSVEVVASAFFDDGQRVDYEVRAVQPNRVVLVERRTNVNSEVYAGITPTGVNPPTTAIYHVFTYIQEESYADLDTTTTSDASGTAAGMNMSGTAHADYESNLTVAPDGSLFTATSFDGSISGSATLTNPNTTTLKAYQSWSGALVYFNIVFEVWGGPAEIDLEVTGSGSVWEISYSSRPDDESIVLTECSNSENPCGTIVKKGPLPPGIYKVAARLSGSASLDYRKDAVPAQSGTKTYDGTARIRLSVSQGGATANSERASIRSSRAR